MKNVFSMLGLCMKAGLLTSGEYMVEKAIKDETAKLVIISEDASENTKKKFNNMCAFRNIEIIEFGDKYSIGKALGKDIRATIGILDEGFAKNIKIKIGK